jgi:ADP-heptose:LPS heptosyltransferase
MRELGKELAACCLVVGNDTGGMHLANAVGTPVAVLFGPTNLLVTGPFFEGSKLFIQPEGCPREGGSSIQLLDSNEVGARLIDFLEDGLISEGKMNVD